MARPRKKYRPRKAKRFIPPPPTWEEVVQMFGEAAIRSHPSYRHQTGTNWRRVTGRVPWHVVGALALARLTLLDKPDLLTSLGAALGSGQLDESQRAVIEAWLRAAIAIEKRKRVKGEDG